MSTYDPLGKGKAELSFPRKVNQGKEEGKILQFRPRQQNFLSTSSEEKKRSGKFQRPVDLGRGEEKRKEIGTQA